MEHAGGHCERCHERILELEAWRQFNRAVLGFLGIAAPSLIGIAAILVTVVTR